MPIGDDAAAAGLEVFTGLEDADTIATLLNIRGDEIAQRTSAILPVAKGGTGASNPGAARANLGAAPTVHTHSPSQIGHGTLDVGPVGYVLAGGGLNSFGARNLIITNGPATAAIAVDGVFGIVGSSERFKKYIRPVKPDRARLDAILAMQVVTFVYRAGISGDTNGKREQGVIAEQLLALGLDWLVVFDGDGAPLSVHYDRIAIELLLIVQDHERRIVALEQDGDI